jgi:hypothetical protein
MAHDAPTHAWALLEFVDLVAQDAAQRFLDRWKATLCDVHNTTTIRVPSLDDAMPCVNALITNQPFEAHDITIEPRPTLFIDDLITAADNVNPTSRTTAPNLLWSIVRDPVEAALRCVFELSGRRLMILSKARDLKTTSPKIIRDHFQAHNAEVPSFALISKALQPPLTVLRSRGSTS